MTGTVVRFSDSAELSELRDQIHTGASDQTLLEVQAVAGGLLGRVYVPGCRGHERLLDLRENAVVGDTIGNASVADMISVSGATVAVVDYSTVRLAVGPAWSDDDAGPAATIADNLKETAERSGATIYCYVPEVERAAPVARPQRPTRRVAEGIERGTVTRLHVVAHELPALITAVVTSGPTEWRDGPVAGGSVVEVRSTGRYTGIVQATVIQGGSQTRLERQYDGKRDVIPFIDWVANLTTEYPTALVVLDEGLELAAKSLPTLALRPSDLARRSDVAVIVAVAS